MGRIRDTHVEARHWSWRQAVLCTVLLWVTGWQLARWHPWVQVRWPQAMPYALFCALVAGVCWLVMSPWGKRLIPRELTWAGAAVVFAVFFHFDLRSAAVHHGADNTEALTLGSHALLHGHDPYNQVTHLGNAIGPLLGGIVLAVPLYAAAGTLIAQIPLWWAGCAAVAELAIPRAGFVVCVLLAASPWTRATLPYQNDNGLCAAGVVLGTAWGWWLVRHEHRNWVRWVWVGTFACALDYRITMWAIALPLAALFVRALGWSQAMRWLGPVVATTVALFALPILFPSGAYLHHTLGTDQTQHPVGPLGNVGTVLVFATTGIVLVVGSVLVRSVADVWLVMAATLLTMLVGFALVTLPDLGLEGSFYRYSTYWYLGWVLVYGIAGAVAWRSPHEAETHDSTELSETGVESHATSA